MPPPAARPAAPVRPVLRRDARRGRASIWKDPSARARFLRRALPTAIGALLLLLFGWIATRAVLTSLSERHAKVEDVRMTHPKFYGRDNKGRPYTVVADTATRDRTDVNQIALQQPVFILQSGGPKPTVVRSLTGLYREDTKALILSGQVSYEDGTGYRFDTERALVDTVTGVTTGQTPIAGSGPLGQVSSSSYAFYDGGARVTFTGNVKARLNNQSGGR